LLASVMMARGDRLLQERFDIRWGDFVRCDFVAVSLFHEAEETYEDASVGCARALVGELRKISRGVGLPLGIGEKARFGQRKAHPFGGCCPDAL
jgi:hypothetical protein